MAQLDISASLAYELEEMPTLAQGQGDDLKIDSDEHGLPQGALRGDGFRVWLHRGADRIAEGEIRENGNWSSADDDEIRQMLDLARLHNTIYYTY